MNTIYYIDSFNLKLLPDKNHSENIKMITFFVWSIPHICSNRYFIVDHTQFDLDIMPIIELNSKSIKKTSAVTHLRLTMINWTSAPFHVVK